MLLFSFPVLHISFSFFATRGAVSEVVSLSHTMFRLGNSVASSASVEQHLRRTAAFAPHLPREVTGHFCKQGIDLSFDAVYRSRTGFRPNGMLVLIAIRDG